MMTKTFKKVDLVFLSKKIHFTQVTEYQQPNKQCKVFLQ